MLKTLVVISRWDYPQSAGAHPHPGVPGGGKSDNLSLIHLLYVPAM